MSPNKTENLIEEKQMERIYEKLSGKSREELACIITAFFLSFGYASFSAAESISPFGVSFVCALPFDCCFSGLAGAVFGYFFSKQWKAALKYWTALVICCLIRIFIHKKDRLRENTYLYSLVSFLAVFLTSAVSCFFSPFSLKAVIFVVAESILSFCCTSLFQRSIKVLSLTFSDNILKLRDGIFAVISLCLFALSVSGYTLKGASIGRIAAFSAVILIAFFKGPSGGSVAGICAGVFLSFQPGFSHLFAAVTLGGFASGLAADMGRLSSALSFLITAAASSLLSVSGEKPLVTAAEAAVACFTVCMLSFDRVEKLRKIICRKERINDKKTEKQVARVLLSASKNLSQVCGIISAAGDRMGEGTAGSPTDVAGAIKIAELQRVLTDQFNSISEYLSGLAEDVSSRRIPDCGKGAALKLSLRDGGVSADEVDYFTDKNGAVTVELTLIDRAFDIDWKRAAEIIGGFTKRRFEKPELQVTQLRTVLAFTQKQPYRLQIGCAVKAAEEGSVCGDTVSAVSSVNGHGFALISDGMGTGKGAAADSRLTAAVMKKLVCSGFSFDSAIKIVNSALIARSNEESVASIDAIEVDLMNGEAVFYKAGASCSFVRKGESIATLNKKSLPVGILRGVAFSKARFKAQAGDIVVLVSDGVAQKEEQWLCEALLSWENSNMEELSMHILKLAVLKNQGHADDMTVVAVRVEKNI